MTVRGGPASLKTRLILGGLVWLALALAAAGAFLSWQFRQYAQGEFDARLSGHLDRLTAAIEIDATGQVALSTPLIDPRFQAIYSGLYWQVGEGVAARLTSRSLWDGTLPIPDDTLEPGTVHRHEAAGPDGAPVVIMERLVAAPGYPRPLRLTVASDVAALRAAVERFDTVLALALLALGTALGAAMVLQVATGLAPLRRLRRALRDLRDGRAARVDGGLPEEIAPAIDDLNAMLERNETLIARARRQAGDLAHALKTPLAVALGSLEEGEKTATARQALADVARILERRTAEARAAGGRIRVGVHAVPRQAAEQLSKTIAALYRDRDLAIEIDVGPALRVAVDPDDLREMLGNLMDNAGKWARRRIRVSARLDGATATVSVEDDGPGIPPEMRREALAPGRRLDESRPGSGLGLAIAGDLAALYGGAVALDRAALGGLAARLTLPAAVSRDSNR